MKKYYRILFIFLFTAVLNLANSLEKEDIRPEKADSFNQGFSLLSSGLSAGCALLQTLNPHHWSSTTKTFITMGIDLALATSCVAAFTSGNEFMSLSSLCYCPETISYGNLTEAIHSNSNRFLSFPASHILSKSGFINLLGTNRLNFESEYYSGTYHDGDVLFYLVRGAMNNLTDLTAKTCEYALNIMCYPRQGAHPLCWPYIHCPESHRLCDYFLGNSRDNTIGFCVGRYTAQTPPLR